MFNLEQYIRDNPDSVTVGPRAVIPASEPTVKQSLTVEQRSWDELKGVMFQAACESHGLPKPTPEFHFCPGRKWAFDWAWPELRVALEIEGGVWTKGRHTRGAGFLRDVEKYNESTILGWSLLRCTPDDVKTGYVFELLKRALLA